MEGARLIGEEKLLDTNFRFSQRVRAVEGAESEVLNGVLIGKEVLQVPAPPVRPCLLAPIHG